MKQGFISKFTGIDKKNIMLNIKYSIKFKFKQLQLLFHLIVFYY